MQGLRQKNQLRSHILLQLLRQTFEGQKEELQNNQQKMIIDLCCGIGRWETNEEVISIDIQKRLKPTICADIRFLPLRPKLKPRLVHASPPCKYVSKARRWRYGWNPKGVAESFRLLAACYEAFAYLEGETCTLEQPAGLEDLLGIKISFRYDKGDIRNATTNFYSNNKSLRRAEIPQDIKQAILKAIEK